MGIVTDLAFGNKDRVSLRRAVKTVANFAALPTSWQLSNSIWQSEAFDNAAFQKVNCTVSANATTGPDGQSNADTLVEDGTASTAHYLLHPTVLSDGIHVASIYAKETGAGSKRYLGLVFSNTPSGPVAPVAIFDLATGSITHKNAPALHATCESVGNGWYRCSLYALVLFSGTVNFQIRVNAITSSLANYSGDSTSGMHLHGFHVTRGDAANTYQQTTGSVVKGEEVFPGDIYQTLDTGFRYRATKGANKQLLWVLIGRSPASTQYTLDLDFTTGAYTIDDAHAMTIALADILQNARASKATYFDSSGNLQEANNDTLVIDHVIATGVVRGLRSERKATNYVRNPRLEGASVGAPGVLPTYMTITCAGGINYQVAGVGTMNNIPYTDLRFTGTALDTSRVARIDFDDPAQCPVFAANEDYCGSVYVAIPNGGAAMPGGGTLLVGTGRFTTGPVWAACQGQTITPTTAWQRGQMSPAGTSTNNRTAEVVTEAAVVSTVYDFTIRVGGPMLEMVDPMPAFTTLSYTSRRASSLILPPAGSPAQTTREADKITVKTTTHPISRWIRKNAATIGIKFMLNYVNANIVTQVLLNHAHAGNDIYLQHAGTTGAANIGGAGALSGSITSFISTLLTEYELAYTFNASVLRMKPGSGAVVAGTNSGVPNEITSIELGHSASGIGALGGGDSVMDGFIRRLKMAPRFSDDTALDTWI